MMLDNPCILAAQARQYDEYEIKAALLYNFTRFVTWPDEHLKEAGAPLVIGMLNSTPSGAPLERIVEGKTVRGRPLVLRWFASPDQVDSCQVLFIGGSNRDDLLRVLDRFGSKGMLTVGERDGFAGDGGVINLYLDGSRVRFEINVQAAEAAGLEISSRVLRLARIVRPSGEVTPR